MTMCDLPFIFPREYLNGRLISNTNCLKELTKHYNKGMNIFMYLVKENKFTKTKFIEEYNSYEKT